MGQYLTPEETQRRSAVNVISWNWDIQWHARYLDSSASDYFLWGFLKNKVDINHPKLENIREKPSHNVGNDDDE
jgi:hypothetical protein